MTRAFDTITLQQVKIAATAFLDGHALENMEMTTWPDVVTNQLAVQLRTFVMGEKVHETSKSVYFEYPETWVQYFKWRFAPQWVKARWPVRMKRLKRTVKFEQIQCFPKFKQVFPRDQQKYEFPHFNMEETFAYSPFE